MERSKSKRVVTKIGDIFAVKVSHNSQKFVQLIAFDITQLNSDVIRAFRSEYPADYVVRAPDIVKDDVEFYAHCVTKWGVKLDIWKKVGKSDDVGPTDNIIFRDTSDYGRAEGQEPILISENWYVWKIGDESFTRVGKLQGENRGAEIGLVFNPISIANRIRTGKYDLPFYPSYE